MTFTLKKIAESLGASEIKNCPDPNSVEISRVSSLKAAASTSLSFITVKTALPDARASKAGAILVSADLVSQLTGPCVVVPNVEAALITTMNLFVEEKKPGGRRSPTAAVDPTATIGEGTDLGHFVSVGAGSKIGKNCIIEAGVFVGVGVTIGDDCRIGANCVFHDQTIIGNRFVVFGNSTFGGDGFRFAHFNGKHNKVPHVGRTVIGDDVEIGANSCVDRGVLEDTIIGDGCKFDNHVHVGHNCVLGKNVIIAGQSGVAGSTTIGDDVLVGGATAIADHLIVPSKTIVAGGTLLRNSPESAGVFAGTEGLSFIDFQKFRVNVKYILQLSKWSKRLQAIEDKLGLKKD